MSTKEQKERIELLQGTLDLLILRTLLPKYAEIVQDIAGCGLGCGLKIRRKTAWNASLYRPRPPGQRQETHVSPCHRDTSNEKVLTAPGEPSAISRTRRHKAKE